MHHLAIMNKSWKLIPKILSGEKTIESRWYMTRRSPWNTVSVGDTIFFKDSGSPVVAKAEVSKVLQQEHFSTAELRAIILKYGGSPGICFVSSSAKTVAWAKNKKYCILMFLKNPQSITPFDINKKGFGNACAWITVKNIRELRIEE